MTVLFVCTWNQGRSQIAQVLFHKMRPSDIALSAGTKAIDNPGSPLRVCAPFVVQIMNEIGIDVSNNYPKRLTEEMCKNADWIIVFNQMELLPDYAKIPGKTLHWPLGDPDTHGYEYHVFLRNEIEKRLNDWLKKLSNEEVNIV